MSDRLRHFQRAGAHRFERFLEFENPDKAAQRNYPATVLVIAGSLSDEYSNLICPERLMLASHRILNIGRHQQIPTWYIDELCCLFKFDWSGIPRQVGAS